MLELVILACLKAEPADCRRVSAPFEGSLTACVVAGQFAVAAWAAAHPAVRVMRWSCGPLRRAV